MLILLTIFLLIIIPLVMLILHLTRPKFSIQGFLAVLAVLAGWLIILFAHSDVPKTITLLSWQTAVFYPSSPTLLVDDISWYFAIAIMTLALSSIVTSIAQLGKSLKPDPKQIDNKVEVIEVQNQSEIGTSTKKNSPFTETSSTSIWQSWAGILVLTSLGLVAVTAGNILTLIMAWAALDLIELAILLSQILENKSRERIILAFAARMAAIGMVLLASVNLWSKDISLNFYAIDQTTSIYLILAAGLRLGVLPLQVPFIQQLYQKRELGIILRLVPSAASFILLVRVANIGVIGAASPFLLGLSVLVGLYAGINWMAAKDELNGQPYWLLGTASLAIASAILNRPSASIAWSIASLLSGGLIFSMPMRHKNLIPFVLLGFIGFSALPFSPTWLGTDLYRLTGSPSNPITPSLFFMFPIAFLLIQSFFLAGFIRHILRGVFPTEEQSDLHIERWVWFLYPIGLIFIIVTHYLIGIMLYPILSEIPLTGWIMGAAAVTISGVIWYLSMHFFHGFAHLDQSIKPSAFTYLFSLEWLYHFIWSILRTLTRLSSLISTILEGDGGILWALVLFALIFVFLQR
jgi:hypothetical protein